MNIGASILQGGRRIHWLAVAVLLLCLLSATSLTAQIDSTDIDSIPAERSGLDSTGSPPVPVDSIAGPDIPRPDIVPRFLPNDPFRTSVRERAVLNPTASLAELIPFSGLLRSHHTFIPAAPSTISYGSSGPGSVPILYSGAIAEHSGGMPLEPSWIPVFRVGDVEVLRGVDASLYAGVSARGALHVVPQSFDVDGSYVRFGYTGAPGEVARVAALYARNIADDRSISFNFRRTPGSDVNTTDDADIIGGDIELSYFPDPRSRVSFRAELHELDRIENGGLRLDGKRVYSGLLEEGRRRSIHLAYTTYPDGLPRSPRQSGLDTIVEGNPDSIVISDRRTEFRPLSMISTTLYYQHAARYLSGVDSVRRESVADIVGLSASWTSELAEQTLLRTHVQGSMSNGGIGMVHAAGLIGFGSGRPFVEAGGGVSGEEGHWQFAGLASLNGEIGEVDLSLDGRFYPGDIILPDTLNTGFPVFDASPLMRFATRWIAEGRASYVTESIGVELETALRRFESNDSRSGLGVDLGLESRFPVGPFELTANGALVSNLGIDELFPTLSGRGRLGYSFDLFRGALDLYTAVVGEVQTSSGGFRYDPVLDLWFSAPADRATPRQLLPYLSAVATARIGTAFFSFELVNLLNTEYWTIRRRPYSGTGLRFGLTWGLID